MGPTGQAEGVLGSRNPEALLGGASEDFSQGSACPWSLQNQVRPEVLAARCWESEEGRTKWPRETGQRGRIRRKGRKREQEPNDGPSACGETPEVVEWGEELLPARTGPRAGGGAPSVESLRTGRAGGSPSSTRRRQRASPGRAVCGMTSSLPSRSATEALLFRALGRHDAMRSLKVKERAAFAAKGSVAPGGRGPEGERSAGRQERLPWGSSGLSSAARGPPSHFREPRQARCSGGSWPPALLRPEHLDRDFSAAHLVCPAGLRVKVAGKTKIPCAGRNKNLSPTTDNPTSVSKTF